MGFRMGGCGIGLAILVEWPSDQETNNQKKIYIFFFRGPKHLLSRSRKTRKGGFLKLFTAPPPRPQHHTKEREGERERATVLAPAAEMMVVRPNSGTTTNEEVRERPRERN